MLDDSLNLSQSQKDFLTGFFTRDVQTENVKIVIVAGYGRHYPAADGQDTGSIRRCSEGVGREIEIPVFSSGARGVILPCTFGYQLR